MRGSTHPSVRARARTATIPAAHLRPNSLSVRAAVAFASNGARSSMCTATLVSMGFEYLAHMRAIGMQDDLLLLGLRISGSES